MKIIQEIAEEYSKLTKVQREKLLNCWRDGISSEKIDDPVVSAALESILKKEAEMSGAKKEDLEAKVKELEEKSVEREELLRDLQKTLEQEKSLTIQKSQPIQPVQPYPSPQNFGLSFKETQVIAAELYNSKYYPSVGSPSQAVVKILAGKELGLGPTISLSKVYIVNGRTAVEAEIMGDMVKRTPKYNYRIKELNNETAHLIFFENGQEMGNSIFTIKDAQQADLLKKDVWKKYPRNMLFARALSNGARWYCPDAIHGTYTYEEMGLSIDGQGQVIHGSGDVVESEIVGDTGNKQTREEEVREIVNKLKREVVQELKDKLKIKDSLLDLTNEDWDKFKKELKKFKPTKKKPEAETKKQGKGEVIIEGEVVGGREEEVKAIIKKFKKKNVLEFKLSMGIKDSLLKIEQKLFDEFKTKIEEKFKK